MKTLFVGETRQFSLPSQDALTDYTAKFTVTAQDPLKTEAINGDCTKSADNMSFVVRFETTTMKQGDYTLVVMVKDTTDNFTFKAYEETLKLVK